MTKRRVGKAFSIFVTTRTEILDLHQEKSTIFELVDKASLYILTNTRRRFIIKGDGPRDEIPELPRAAVKEILMNSYAHRDWTRHGCVTLDIFYDSVEVLSPGWFIEGQNPDEHLNNVDHSSTTRNELIAEILFRSKDIESYGTGIPRVKDLCAQEGVGVEYRHEGNNTRFIFHRNDAFAGNSLQTSEKRPIPVSNGQQWESLSTNERSICAYLQMSERAGAAKISEDLAIARRTTGRVLKKLIEKGFVVASGESKSRIYSLKQ